MANSVKLEIITPSKRFYRGDVEIVIVNTMDGEEGFMANHSWACKLLDIGEAWIQEVGADKDEFKVAAIAGGFIDVKDSIVIFTDAAEWAEEIDMERVSSEKEKAEAWLKLHEVDGSPSDIEQARTAISKAAARTHVALGGGKRRR